MSSPISHLIVSHILPHLSPRQIDGLREINHELNKQVEKKRMDLPRFNLKFLEIQQPCDGFHKICFENVAGSYQKETMEIGKLANNLRSVTVSYLELVGTSSCELLTEKWLSTIKKVHIKNIDNEKKVEEFVKKLKASRLFLAHNENEMSGEHILDNMPSVEQLELEKCNFSPEFFQKLTEKTKLGGGLGYLYLKDWCEKPFFSVDFLNFLKNAKFSDCGDNHIKIQAKLGENLMFVFHEMLAELSNMAGWTVHQSQTYNDASVDLFVIDSPTSELTLEVDYY